MNFKWPEWAYVTIRLRPTIPLAHPRDASYYRAHAPKGTK